MRAYSLRHLQQHLPWALPYSDHFYAANEDEGHRYLSHDLMHVLKSMGSVAAVVERIDHGREAGMDCDELADKVADLVICALHMAKTSPLGTFDLHDVVVRKLEQRNNFSYPQETAGVL